MSYKDENYWKAVLEHIKGKDGYLCPLCGFLTADFEEARNHQVAHMLNLPETMAQIFNKSSTGLGKEKQKEVSKP